ncbi:hypothetical protein [Pseudomonas anguilliseptica]|uniref:hypothetical protein n=1 Tax=Pseudomonas anguilliseptica TaxID=53406 RepID=UPI003736DA12
MLILDRVVCDECLCVMGQLHHMPAEQSDLLSDFRTAPDYAVCPDCREPFVFEFAQQLEAGE